jgi:hypothetical protein
VSGRGVKLGGVTFMPVTATLPSDPSRVSMTRINERREA